jgi:hypothetical protein
VKGELLLEALYDRRISNQIWSDDLEGYGTSEFTVASLVDRTHSSLT